MGTAANDLDMVLLGENVKGVLSYLENFNKMLIVVIYLFF